MREIGPDVVVFLDAGLPRTIQEGLNNLSLINVNRSTDNRNVVLVPFAGDIINGVTSPIRGITATYEIAKGLPLTWREFGPYSIYAGYTNGVIRFMRFYDTPRKTRDSSVLKNLRETAILFPFIVDRSGRTAWMDEPTQYNSNRSVLSSIRNNIVVGDATRVAQSILIKYINSGGGLDETIISSAETELLDTYTARYPSEIGIDVNILRTANDIATNNARVELSIAFPNTISRYTFTVVVTRQQSTALAEGV